MRQQCTCKRFGANLIPAFKQGIFYQQELVSPDFLKYFKVDIQNSYKIFSDSTEEKKETQQVNVIGSYFGAQYGFIKMLVSLKNYLNILRKHQSLLQ